MYEIILVGFKFGDLISVKSPIRQIKNLAKVSRYTVYYIIISKFLAANVKQNNSIKKTGHGRLSSRLILKSAR